MNPLYLLSILTIASLPFISSCNRDSTPSGSNQSSVNNDQTDTSDNKSSTQIAIGSNLKQSEVGFKVQSNEEIITNAFFIDPIHGSASGDGSKEAPWNSLQDLINSGLLESRAWSEYPAENLDESYLKPMNEGAPIKGGDTIYLMNGNYGDLSISEHYNSAPIIIKAYPGQKPVFTQMKLTSSANWVFENIAIDRTGLELGPALFLANNHSWTGNSWDISLINSQLTGSRDINAWGLQEWLSVGGGIRSYAKNFKASGNTIENVRDAVLSQGANSLFEYNIINQYAFDAIRGFGEYSEFKYNLIKNSVYTDYSLNHDDAFQSWILDANTPQVGIVLHGNVIIDNHDLHKSPSPFLATRTPRVQAIGLFDGPFWNWKITNNAIVVSSSHGISTDKLKHSTVTGNVLIQNPNNTAGSTPQISLRAKTGTAEWPVVDNVIAENVMPRKIYIVPDTGIKAEESTLRPNYISSQLTIDIFNDYANGDFALNEQFSQLINEYFSENQNSEVSFQASKAPPQDETSAAVEEPENDSNIGQTRDNSSRATR